MNPTVILRVFLFCAGDGNISTHLLVSEAHCEQAFVSIYLNADPEPWYNHTWLFITERSCCFDGLWFCYKKLEPWSQIHAMMFFFKLQIMSLKREAVGFYELHRRPHFFFDWVKNTVNLTLCFIQLHTARPSHIRSSWVGPSGSDSQHRHWSPKVLLSIPLLSVSVCRAK